ncbi:hypothetical protein [Natronomonas sp.]|uniref:hypothetical protein n=1 Tax=Natronomonas sp. TaxID=2184060 RepID=UPI0039770B20
MLAGCLGGNGNGGNGNGGNGNGGNGNGGGDFSGETLNVLTWSGYEGVADLVEERTGANLNLSMISSDVEGFNQLGSGGTNEFEVLVLDNDWAVRNAEADHIVPLNEDEYPEADGLHEEFAWPYETFEQGGDVWALPPRWGWGGLGYDDREVDLEMLEDEGYTVCWTGGSDGSLENELTLVDWPTWVIPLVILEVFDYDENPMQIELSESELGELEEVLIQLFDNTTAVHSGAAAVRQDLVEGNASLVFGTGNFALSQIAKEGNEWMKIMFPEQTGGWYWVEGTCLINNSNLNRDLAVEFQRECLSPEGQYSICYGDAESLGAPVMEEAFDEFTEEEQRQILLYKDQGFEAMDEILNNMYQYLISPQQDEWLDMWERAKAQADIN